jgi:hypothetical protein
MGTHNVQGYNATTNNRLKPVQGIDLCFIIQLYEYYSASMWYSPGFAGQSTNLTFTVTEGIPSSWEPGTELVE